MAEFVEIMRQAARLCGVQEQCIGCPLVNVDHALCELRKGVMQKFSTYEACKVERIVMDWAEKNPEPRYPTWKEWQERMFPDALCDMCPRVFGVAPMDGCVNVSCDDCMSAHIPANIAEKLGIKLIGGDDNG